MLVLSLMITLIEVTKSENESNANLLRRFSRRVKGTGYVNRAKSLRYSTRRKSALKKKQDALKRIRKQIEIERLKKLGKIRDGFSK